MRQPRSKMRTLALCLLALGGCVVGHPPLTPEQVAFLEARAYRLIVPHGYDGSAAVPFVVLLHGYSSTGVKLDEYFGMSALAEARTFILATPDGLKDQSGHGYWNAGDCCDLDGTDTDDVAYLTAILDDVRLRFRIDSRRVFVIGHSNGGFLAHRVACDRASRVAAIVSLAGAQRTDIAQCEPTEPVAVLQVHGDQDEIIKYGGNTTAYPAYPGAIETIRGWATLDGCKTDSLVSAGGDLDLDMTVGTEAKKEGYQGCPRGISAELWTLRGGPHIPKLNETWGAAIYDFLIEHPKR